MNSSQTFYFENGQATVTTEGIQFKPYTTLALALSHSLSISRTHSPIPHTLDEAFLKEEPFGVHYNSADSQYEVTFPDNGTEAKKCHVFRFLWHSSEKYWKMREEGRPTTPQQDQEEMQHLVNKLWTVGYILCGNKSQKRAFMPIGIDLSEGPEGMTGKSFFYDQTFAQFAPVRIFDGKNEDLFENPWWAYGVTPQHILAVFDDVIPEFDLKSVFNYVVGDFPISEKGVADYSIPFAQSPIIAVASNYVVDVFSEASIARRTVLNGFYDYFNKTRSIGDMAGKNIFDTDYTPEEWMRFYRTYLLCIKIYLQHPDRIQMPLEDARKKVALSNTPKNA